jgi:hypothetical protein
MAKNIKSTAASVHQRLLKKAKDKKAQWLGFIKKAKVADAPGSFENVAAAVKVFLEPIVASIVERQTFHRIWTAPGPSR